MNVTVGLVAGMLGVPAQWAWSPARGRVTGWFPSGAGAGGRSLGGGRFG